MPDRATLELEASGLTSSASAEGCTDGDSGDSDNSGTLHPIRSNSYEDYPNNECPTAEHSGGIPLYHLKPNAPPFPPPNLLSNEPPLDSDLHRRQIELLIRLLEWAWQQRQDFYASGNLTIYFSPYQKKSEDFRGPDFFVVLGTERRDRSSWVVWQENGKYPNVIVEILSDSTAAVDRGVKKQIYQDTFRTPDYFWFDPITLEFQGFHLVDGCYQPLVPTHDGWLWSEQLQLFLGIQDDKLWFFTAQGEALSLPEDELRSQVEQERRLVEQERQRADQAEQQLAQLRALLQAQQPDP